MPWCSAIWISKDHFRIIPSKEAAPNTRTFKDHLGPTKASMGGPSKIKDKTVDMLSRGYGFDPPNEMSVRGQQGTSN